MILNYKISLSSVIPDLIDTATSSKFVYIRKDVCEKTDCDSNVYYEYQEAKLTKKEYEQYLTELSIADIQKQRADIDYIAFMCDIDLEE